VVRASQVRHYSFFSFFPFFSFLFLVWF
jgi:hypothetical protein